MGRVGGFVYDLLFIPRYTYVTCGSESHGSGSAADLRQPAGERLQNPSTPRAVNNFFEDN